MKLRNTNSSAPQTVLNREILITLCLLPLVCLGQTARDEKADVGGYQLRYVQAGSGKPVVVFESGLGEDLSTWNAVQPQVAGFTGTFGYDRAGLGKSDPSPHPRTVEQMATELHALLHATKVLPPYVLVGHSLGGAIVTVFARAYPSEVAGLVLVDPEDGRLDEMLRTHMTPADWAARQKAVAEALPQMPAAVRAELDAYHNSGKAGAEGSPFPKVPVVLLTGTKKSPEFPGNPMEQDLKLQLHQEFLAKTPGSEHVLVPNSRHYIQNDAPGLVIEAIRRVVRHSASTGGSKSSQD